MKRKFKGRVFLQNLQLSSHQTKVCSIKDVCKGVPLPNTKEFFYEGNSGCKACLAKKSKEKWAEKKKDTIFFKDT